MKRLLNTKVILLDEDLNKIISTGNLYFIGVGIWGKQCTVGRTPHKLSSYEQVIPYTDEIFLTKIKIG